MCRVGMSLHMERIFFPLETVFVMSRPCNHVTQVLDA